MGNFSEEKLSEISEEAIQRYMEMKVLVYRDGECVFGEATAFQFLYENQFQDEVLELVDYAYEKGKAKDFLGDCVWEVCHVNRDEG